MINIKIFIISTYATRILNLNEYIYVTKKDLESPAGISRSDAYFIYRNLWIEKS